MSFEVIKDFVMTYYKVIIAAVLYLILFIVNLVKRRPKLLDTIKEVILENLPHFINEVEKPGNGELKKEQVIGMMLAFLEKLYPGIQVSQYESFIAKSIEAIGKTPHFGKKG